MLFFIKEKVDLNLIIIYNKIKYVIINTIF